MNPTFFKAGIQDVQFGKNVKIVEPVNLYGCKIGDDCFIGPFTEIQKGAIIGNQTRIQSHSFICDLVTIGENCFIGHGVVFINDLFQEGGPAGGDRGKYKSTKIGHYVSIGSNATILPVTIADHTVIGAGSVVTKDISEPGIYAGNPAKLVRKLPKK
jgi:acetyltransferase-like isoleucine patch superfamily enzyme